ANPTNGLINRAFGSVLNVYSEPGIICVLATSSYPLVLFATLAALESIDPALEEAARISGAGHGKVLWDVTLPLVARAICPGPVLCALQSAASFGVPYLLGSFGVTRVRVLSTAIYESIGLGTADGDAHAATLSLGLCLLAALGIYLSARLRKRARA